MTKEPKLQAAVRIVAEWTDYDQEIKRLQTRVQEDVNHRAKQQGTGTARSQHSVKTSALITVTDASLSLPLSDVHTELWIVGWRQSELDSV